MRQSQSEFHRESRAMWMSRWVYGVVSKVDEPVSHLLWLHPFPDLGQRQDDLPDASLALARISDPRMVDAARIDGEKVLVVSNDHPPLGTSVCNLNLVGGTEQLHVIRGGYVDAPTSQTFRN